MKITRNPLSFTEGHDVRYGRKQYLDQLIRKKDNGRVKAITSLQGTNPPAGADASLPEATIKKTAFCRAMAKRCYFVPLAYPMTVYTTKTPV